MLIESSNTDFAKTFPEALVARLNQALALMGYGTEETKLTIVDRKPKRPGQHDPISLVRHEDLVLVLEIQPPGTTSLYVCRLAFERKCNDGGLMGRLLWTRLERTLKELNNGRTPPAPEQISAQAQILPPEPKYHAQRFTNDVEKVRVVMCYLRRKHGDGPHSVELIKEVLRESLHEVLAPGRIITTLESRGWLRDAGSGTFYLVPTDQEPKATAPVRTARTEANDVSSDPALARLAKVTDLMKSQSRMRTTLTDKEERLKKLEAERLALDAKILALQAEIKQDRKLLLTPEKMKGLDSVLKDLGIELPEDDA